MDFDFSQQNENQWHWHNICFNLPKLWWQEKYDSACSHPEYQLVELKSGHHCVRLFWGFYTFDEAQMIWSFDRSSKFYLGT